VYGIITQAGGSISVDSEEGTGTTFCVYFPVSSAVMLLAPDPAAPGTGGNGQTILVVDDEPVVLAATSRILRQNGYATLEAASYDQALTLAASHQVQLLLTDSVMPRMSGPAVADRITELKPGLPVVYMTGYGLVSPDPSPGSNDQAAGIQKPFTPQTLLQAVRHALETA
jgi:DNA-binding NtrC family response regulator